MKTITTILEVAGVVAIVAGIAIWSIPAALVVAGSGSIAFSWRLTGGGS